MAMAGRGNSTNTEPTECNFVPDDPVNGTFSGVIREVDRRRPIAVPVSDTSAKRRQISRLSRRGGTVTYDDTCNAAPPQGSTWGERNGFPTMRSVLEASYADAVRLATTAQNVNADNIGFTHYFGGFGADVQLAHFRRMMQGVANGANNYAIHFVCEDPQSVCSDTSVMVTDATRGTANTPKTITVCDSFWTGASTKYLLHRADKSEPTPPYRDDTPSGWCQKRAQAGDPNVSRQPVQFFATAGNSVLHELTHLDSLAEFAGLTSDPDEEDGAHGTLDAQKGCELTGARTFLRDYIAGRTSGTSPDYNAESYAAAATEIFFMGVCGFTQIRPWTAP
jgi:hypothetical protein